MKYVYSFCVLCFCVACVKDKPNPSKTIIPFDLVSELIILNEGSFGNNNSDVSVFSNKYQQINQFTFKNGKSLGDVAQDIVFTNNKYFITLNGSNSMAVCNSDFSLHAAMSGISFPRYISPINQHSAYISSLYNPYVYVFDLDTYKIKDTILMSYKNTENMLVSQNDVYVTCWNTECKYLYKVNTQTHQLYDSIDLKAYAPHHITKDNTGRLWVLCGNKYKGVRSALVQVDPVQKSIIKKIEFLPEQDPFRLQINTHGDTLFFIMINYDGKDENNGLYKMSIHDNTIPSTPFIKAPALTYFWGFAIEPITKRIFICDPKGFTQSSSILTYQENGDYIGSFQAGIGSSKILFR